MSASIGDVHVWQRINGLMDYAYQTQNACLTTPMDCEGALETFRCSCKDGFKRINGLCLDENLCQCSENEEYAYGNPCQEKCGVGPQECKGEACYKGCFCREGYRRVSGKCVAESQCPCGKYEEYNYGNDCYEECSKDPKLCRSVETYKKCTCIEGYKRIYGYCMPDTKCKCLVNEIVTYSNDCYEQCGMDPAKCAEHDTIRGCACRPGYVRINGQCVPDSECPCSFNEEYVVGNSCEEECNATPDSCKEVSSYKRCSCRSGFKRIDGLCTEQFRCPCGKNEIYKFGNPCSEDCSKTAYYCDKEESYQGCFCKEGYKRINGKCVEYSACKCGSNEVYTYGNYCDESCDYTLTCDSSSTELRCVCLPFHKRIDGDCVHQSNCKCGENEEYRITEDGVSECVCKDGFRKEHRKCVPYNETNCGQNEIYSTSNECTEQCGIDPATCGPPVSQPRCLCQPGYVRIDGVCVPRSNCQCGANEEYTYSSECIERCEENEDTCKHEVQYERCTCLKSYKRIDGVCEPEVYSTCGNSCYDECGKTKSDCQSDKCFAGCYCQKGFKRIDGVCVPEYKCGPPKCLLPNEVYKKCGRICDDQ
uniref:Uncharacterized protein n=1 Tax=Phlebotomus papatasi TaxID=29031 RepID=A0A1B0GMC4_PHLPP